MRPWIASVAVLALAPIAAGQVKISQVHAQSSLYNRDYVELFNTTGAPVDLTGWWMYTYSGNGNTQMLSGVVPPHAYFLVSVASTGNGTGALPTTPDLVGGVFPIRAPSGAVWLYSSDPAQTSEVDSASWYNGPQSDSALPMNGTNALIRTAEGCVDSDVSRLDFDLAAPAPRNSAVTHTCAFVGPDCNRNGIDDRDEIISDPTLDCDGDGHLDSCQLHVGSFPHCDPNGVPDCVAIRNGAPDVNQNRRVDTCEGGVVIPGPMAVTIGSSGVSADTSSWLAAGAQAPGGPAFAVVRWDSAAIRAVINNSYGPAYPYLDLREIGLSDAAGPVDVFYTRNDAVALNPGAPTPTHADLDTLFGDRELLNTLDFRPHAQGAEQSLFLSTSFGCPAPPGSATSDLLYDIWHDSVTTLLLVPRTPQGAATFAGAGNSSWPGPRMVFFPPADAGPFCGSADFNGDGDVGTDADIYAFFACIAGDCCPTCMCPDFNGDGDVGTDADIESFFRVLAGGGC